MSDIANVRSIDAIERFRSALIVFLEKGKVAVDEVGSDVKKTRYWLEHDRIPYWTLQIKKRLRKLDEAKHELMTARLSDYTEDTMLQQMAVNRAKAAFEEAERKLKTVKNWIREFDSVVMPVAKQLAKIEALLNGRMPKAVAYLHETTRLLDAYARVSNPIGGPGEASMARSSEPESEGSGEEEPKEESE